jgi:hypothetical protein
LSKPRTLIAQLSKFLVFVSSKVSQVVLAMCMDCDNRDISKVVSFVRRLDLIEICYWRGAFEYRFENFLKETGWIKEVSLSPFCPHPRLLTVS